MSAAALISIVDDDESVREALESFVQSLQLRAVAFESAEAFLVSEARTQAACVLLDRTLTGLSGGGLQQELLADERRLPIIFITAHADEEFRDLVLARGAIACLPKPFSEAELLSALDRALNAGG
jgi:FixJ family two-component response regulator